VILWFCPKDAENVDTDSSPTPSIKEPATIAREEHHKT